MRTTLKRLSVGLACVGVICAAGPAVAAKPRHTGDSQVERLNQQQLDAVRAQNGGAAVAPPPGILGAPLMQQTAPSGRMGP